MNQVNEKYLWTSIKNKSNNLMRRCGLLGLQIVLLIGIFSASAYAGTSLNIGDIASNVLKSFENLARLITAASYLAGLGFAIGAIMKFKQHKDNPTQIPIGTPIALVFIAAALLFLPSILGVTGVTVFGAGGGTVAGIEGTVFK